MHHTSVLLWALCACVRAGVQDAGVKLNDVGSVDDKVEELLLQELGERVSDDAKLFITDYLVTHQLQMTVREALGVAAKIRNPLPKTPEAQSEYMEQLGKTLDLADMLRRKMSACPSERGKRVDAFVENGLFKDIRLRLNLKHDEFACPDGEQKFSLPLLTAGFDWGYVEQLKKGLKENPKPLVQAFVGFIQSKGYVSKEMQPMVQLVSAQLMANPEYMEYVVSVMDSFETFFKSESGQRIFKLIPALMTADSETALELFSREAEYNQEAFFNLLANGDLAERFLKSVARWLISAFNWAKKASEDEIKLAIFNGMLISNNFPIYNRRQPLKSGVAIVEKLMKLFTVHRVETNLYQEVKAVADDFERLYFRFEDFAKLKDDEVETVLSRFLQENVMGPLKDAWLANRHVSSVNENCAAQVLCLYAKNYGKSNEIVRTVTKGVSLTLAYTWNR